MLEARRCQARLLRSSERGCEIRLSLAPPTAGIPRDLRRHESPQCRRLGGEAESFGSQPLSLSVFKFEALIRVSHFEGLSNFSPSGEGLVQIQDVDPRL